MRNICAVILMLCMTIGCSIPIKLILTTDPKTIHEERIYQKKFREEEKIYQERLYKERIIEKQEELLTEEEKIAETLGREAYLVWQAFQRAKIGQTWADKFTIASDINKFYTKTEDPTREKLYDYLRETIGGKTWTEKNALYVPGTGFKETWWKMIWLFFYSYGRPWVIDEYYDQYYIETTCKSSGRLRMDIVDKMLAEVENHYLLLEDMEGEAR